MKFLQLKKRLLAGVMTAVLAVSLIAPASAVNSINGDINRDDNITSTYTYTAPTVALAVDENIVTASAHRAASPILGMLGLNATSGFGMINGTAPTSLATAQECAALGIWGSSLNDNPDPYYWNYFYNFYAAEHDGVAVSENALLNGSWAGSPVMADKTLFAEYGNISGSLSTRPDILVGCAASNGADTSGYDDQLATIHSFPKDSEFYQDGDESYNPQLVSYQTTTIENMIASVKALASAVETVEAATGKTTRYGDVQAIASDYETFIYGVIAYVQEELAAKGLEQKTFAFVTAINDDGTFTIGGADYNSATSLGRAYEYCIPVATPLSLTTTTVTKAELLKADVIITLNNANLTATKMAEAGIDSSTYNGILITNNPASLYGITMNSVENAVGYAYVIGSMYSDVLDIDPVELCAYFYQRFEHISDLDSLATVVLTNFSDTILPAGVSATLSSSYSMDKIEAMLVKGMDYYTANETAFDAAQFEDSGIDEWTPDYDLGIGSVHDWDDGVVTKVATCGSAGIVTYTCKDCNATRVELIKATGEHTWGEGTQVADPMYSKAGTVQFTCTVCGAVKSEPVATKEVEFEDVIVGSYYYTPMLWALDQGVTTGISNTIFAPDAECSRAMAVTFLWRAAGMPAPTTTENPFTDVVANTWYYDAVLWAVEEGITNGSSATTFSPEAVCSRAQIATFLYRAANSPEVDDGENPFTDVIDQPSTSWYYDAVIWAVQNGITTGVTATTFAPDTICSRAQIVTFLYRAYN